MKRGKKTHYIRPGSTGKPLCGARVPFERLTTKARSATCKVCTIRDRR